MESKITDVVIDNNTTRYNLRDNNGYRHASRHREFLFLSYIVAGDDVRPVYAGAETDRMVDEGEVPERGREPRITIYGPLLGCTTFR